MKHLFKTIIYLGILLIGLFTQSCTEKDSYQVATFNSDLDIPVGDTTIVSPYLKQLMKHGRVEAIIERYRVIVQEGSTDKKVYQLQGLANGGKTVIAMEVYRGEGNAIVMKSSSLTEGLVICESDCESGCNPKISNGAWSCANACDGKACKKTEVRHYKENNYTTPIQSFMMEDF